MTDKDIEIQARRDVKETIASGNSMDRKSARDHPEWVEEIVQIRIKEIEREMS